MRLLDLIKVITFCYTTRVRAISVVTKPRHRVVITRHIPHILSRYPHRHGGTGQPPDNLMKSIWHRDMNQSEPGLAKNTSSVCQYHSPSALVGTSELRYVTTVSEKPRSYCYDDELVILRQICDNLSNDHVTDGA